MAEQLRVPPFSREDIKALVEEFEQHKFIDMKGIDLDDISGESYVQEDNGEIYKQVKETNKIIVLRNVYWSTLNNYAIVQSKTERNDGQIILYVHVVADDGSAYSTSSLWLKSDGKMRYLDL